MRKIAIILVFWFLQFAASSQIVVTFTNVVQPCHGNDGSVDAIVSGGLPPYSYKWRNYPSPLAPIISTSSSLTSAVPGYYYLTVSDANLIQANDSIFMPGQVYFIGDTVVGPTTYIAMEASAICPNLNANLTYSINGGAAPYTFSLNVGTPQVTSSNSFSFNSLPIGNYTCTVTDNNGCFSLCPGYVGSTPGFWINNTWTVDTCHLNGTTTAIPTGGGTPPFTYLWNTSPPQTTQTAVGLMPGGYYVTVTDANGCVNHGGGWVPDSITPHSLQSSANIQNCTCGSTNGFIALHDTGGVPPYTYQWSNGATTDSIYNLPAGTYVVLVTDAAGCKTQFTKQVFPVSSVFFYTQTRNANCLNTGGADSILVTYGAASPFQYLWSTGDTTSYISNVPSGWYWVTVTDQNGCQSRVADSVSIDSNCVAYVTGKVFNDMNGNCILDMNESVLPQQIMMASNGFMYESDWNGNYTIPIINPIGTYTISQTPKIPWTQICPPSPVIINPVAGNIYNYDYYDKPNPLVNDLEVYIDSDTCRPGFTFNQWVSVFNKGTSTMTGSLTLQHDALLNVINTGNATAYNGSSQTFTFNFTNLPPMEWTTFSIQLQAPIGTTLLTPLNSYAVANPVAGDATPSTNFDTLHYRVTGSYDPNSKSVSPEGGGPFGNISTTDSLLMYSIHFQNTGSYPTSFIDIIDTISPALDIYSLKIVGAAVSGTLGVLPRVSFLSGSVIKFSFPNAYLAPAASDELRSEGFISYTIKQKPNLSIGTQIKNRADIYFDYNTAILTNPTLNTINAVGINNVSEAKYKMSVYPNPGSDNITVNSSLELGIMKIYNSLGETVLQTKGKNKQEQIDISKLSSGIYILQTQNERVKFVKE